MKFVFSILVAVFLGTITLSAQDVVADENGIGQLPLETRVENDTIEARFFNPKYPKGMNNRSVSGVSGRDSVRC